MVDFTAAELRETMGKKCNIRNVAVIGHASHGKSTITSSLVAAAATIQQEVAIEVPTIDTHVNEADRSTGMSLLYEMNNDTLEAYRGDKDGNRYVINLIDSPGHVDFSAEVAAALRVADGALLVIDPIEGVRVQTETVLRQAIGEMVSPVLCFNKMDKLFTGLQAEGAKPIFSGEQVYRILLNVVANSNAIIAACGAKLQIHPENGTVTFSSCLHGWAFTLTSLARKYASVHGVDESTFANRLWGDHFYDSTLKKWLDKDNGSASCTRGFVRFCYDPIVKIAKACMKEDKTDLWRLCKKHGVSLRVDEKQLLGEDLFKCVMQTWLPASSALYEMMIFRTPSPLRAQKYRVKLYKGPPGDSYAEAIENCDPEGPLMLYVSKMIPTSTVGRFFAFGRIFSGRIATGMKVRIMGPSYVPGKKGDVYVKQVLGTVVWMGKNLQGVGDVPCGNTVGVLGFDSCITKCATLTNEEEVAARLIREIKLSAPLVMFVQVKCKVPSDAPRLHEGLKHLTKCDLSLIFSSGESGSFTVAGLGEYHLEICLKYLESIMHGVEINVSSPIVSHRETVLDKTGDPVETLSQNQRNRLSIVARPLAQELVEAIDNGLLGPSTGHAERSQNLSDYGWDGDLDKIWCFGPDAVGPTNMVLDRCQITQHLELVKRSMVATFQMASKEGALAKEIMRGICFEIHDFKIHADDASRDKSAQIDKMVKKALIESQLAAKPRLLEPFYSVLIQCPESALHTVNGILTQRGAYQCDDFVTEETKMFNLRAYISVYDSFGLAKAICAATSGQVTTHCVFGYWDDMSCSPMQASTPAGKRVLEIRRRKNIEKPSFQK